MARLFLYQDIFVIWLVVLDATISLSQLILKKTLHLQ